MFGVNVQGSWFDGSMLNSIDNTIDSEIINSHHVWFITVLKCVFGWLYVSDIRVLII